MLVFSKAEISALILSDSVCIVIKTNGNSRALWLVLLPRLETDVSIIIFDPNPTPHPTQLDPTLQNCSSLILLPRSKVFSFLNQTLIRFTGSNAVYRDDSDVCS